MLSHYSVKSEVGIQLHNYVLPGQSCTCYRTMKTRTEDSVDRTGDKITRIIGQFYTLHITWRFGYGCLQDEILAGFTLTVKHGIWKSIA